jgi:hypothetical protein
MVNSMMGNFLSINEMDKEDIITGMEVSMLGLG